MDVQTFVRSQSFKVTVLVIGVLVVAAVSFAGGVAVGFHKARFSYAFGENYERNFGGSHRGGGGGMFGDFDGRDFRNGHGLSGSVVSVSGNNLIVKDTDNKEYTVQVTDQTFIRDRETTLAVDGLKTGDRVVIVGNPSSDGTVRADLIRVFSAQGIPSTPAPANGTNAN